MAQKQETKSKDSDLRNDNRNWYGYNNSDDDKTMNEETEEGKRDSNTDKEFLAFVFKPTVNIVQLISLRWNKIEKDQLQYKTWGKGSKQTDEKRLHKSKKLQHQVLQCYDIKSIFQKG